MKDLPSDSAKRQIWNNLKEVALEDGHFSEEEQQLLANIIIDIEKYSKMLEIALEDGLITEREKKGLFEGRMGIVEEAYSSAREDSKISRDEMNILKNLCKIVIDIQDEIIDQVVDDE